MKLIPSGILTDQEMCFIGEHAPGLIWFTAARGLEIKANLEVSDIVISLRGKGILNVANLITEPSISHGSYHARMSSREGGSEPYSLPHGGIISTQMEDQPRYCLSLKNNTYIDKLKIHNREGIYSFRALRLRIEMWCNNKQMIVYENDSRAQIIERANDIIELAISYFDNPLQTKSNPLASALKLYLLSYINSVSEIILNLNSSNPNLLLEMRFDRSRIAALLLSLSQARHSPEMTQFLADITDIFIIKSNFIEEYRVDDSIDRAYIQYYEQEQYDLCLAKAQFILDKTSQIENSYLYDFQVTLHSPGLMRHFERDLRHLAVACGRVEPRLSAHGFTTTDLPGKWQVFLTALERTVDELASVGMASALCYGTLLGAHREGAFIPHDDDVDLIVNYEVDLKRGKDAVSQLVSDLVARGWRAYIVEPTLMIKVIPPDSGVEVDVFPCFAEKDALDCKVYMEPGRFWTLPTNMLVPFSDTTKLYGISFPAPANIEGFLEARYGASWRVPIKFEALSWLAQAELAEANEKLAI